MKGRPGFEQPVQRLFREHFDSLFRYLDRLTGDADLAADIAQETFVRLHERGSLPDDPRAWLVAVANNLYRDDRRRTQRRVRLLEQASANVALSPPTADAPDATVLRDETTARVQRALEQLPPRDRQMLLLRHQGFSYREIALALSVAETSVGTLLIRATAAFRKSFREESGAPD